jgi:murein hydrolase activator
VTATACAAFAQDAATDAESLEQAKSLLQEQQTDLKAGQATAGNIEANVANLDAERERLNARLVETAALIQKSEAKMTSIEGRMVELEAQEKVVRGSLGQRHGQIASLLGALQRMGRNPPPALITRREDALTMVRSAMVLSAAFPELRGQALQLTERLTELQRVMSDIRTEGDRLTTETQRLEESRVRLASLMDAKKRSITDKQQELAAVRQASAEISKNVNELGDLITRLDAAVTANVKSMAAYQATPRPQEPVDVAAVTPTPEPAAPAAAPAPAQPIKVEPPSAPEPSNVAAAPTTVAPPAAPPPAETQVAAIQPPKLKPQIVELAPATGSLIPGPASRMSPAIAFASARGKLPLPAQGRRAIAFGERTQYGGQSKGIVIETRGGAQIVSPSDGWIVYAGEFRSYGQLLIINAGDGYHILLAGLSQIDVQPGQFVLAAEPVGTMGGATRQVSTAAPVGSPVLYIEFRKDGRPIDPDPWWASGQQKVQG